jgi:hypothetical protein
VRSARSVITDVAVYAAFGALLAVAFVGVGAVRAVVAVMFGAGRVRVEPDDLRMLAVYCGGFALAGGLLGLFRPLLRTRAGTYAGYAAAGAIVMVMVSVADDGSVRAAFHGFSWIVMVVVGGFFGGAFARGLLRGRDAAPPSVAQ